MSLKVNEIFYSIQGESSYSGLPCVFVRLTGCNLRCSYCDTKYAYEDGDEMEVDEIVNRVKSFNCSLVEVTGGEPMTQQETPLLISELLKCESKVLLETNGSCDISTVDKGCVRIVDVKCPSSGEADKNDLTNLAKLTEVDELKFVIGDRPDYEYAKGVLSKCEVKARYVHFSPIFNVLDPVDLAEWILKDHLPVRLQLQLHKIVWDPNQRGV